MGYKNITACVLAAAFAVQASVQAWALQEDFFDINTAVSIDAEGDGVGQDLPHGYCGEASGEDETAEWVLENGILTVRPGPEEQNDDYLTVGSGGWDNYVQQIHTIRVQSGINIISGGTFAEMSNVWRVYLPDTLTQISETAFRDCDELQYILYEGSEDDDMGSYFARMFTSSSFPENVKFVFLGDNQTDPTEQNGANNPDGGDNGDKEPGNTDNENTDPAPSPTVTETPEPTDEPEPIPSVTTIPEPTEIPNPSPVVTETPEPTKDPEPSPAVTGNPEPTAIPNPSPVVTETPEPTKDPEPSPAVTESPEPTAIPDPSPVVSETPEPTKDPEPSPIATVIPEPTEIPEPSPDITVSPVPTGLPTVTAIPTATAIPTVTETPTKAPELTSEPAEEVTPTESATATPTAVPSETPEPTKVPEPEQGFRVEAVRAQSVTGKAIKPQVEVFDGMVKLAEGVDYTVSYKNNKKVGKASATIKGKGNYTGKRTVYFDILPLDLNDAATLYMNNSFTEGTAPKFSLVCEGKVLKAKKDYKAAYFLVHPDAPPEYALEPLTKVPTGKGDYLLKLSGMGNYGGEITKEFSILPSFVSMTPPAQDISGFKAEIGKMMFGNDALPTVRLIKPAGKNTPEKELVVGTDYIVKFGQTEAGKTVATFVGQGQYSGTLQKSFSISSKSIAPQDVAFVPDTMTSFGDMQFTSYTKGGVRPDVVVKVGENTLTKDLDYTVSYKNANKVSTGTAAAVVVKGKGNYAGEASLTYYITANALFDEVRYKLEKGEEQKNIIVGDAQTGKNPAVTVYDNKGNKLTKGKDYYLVYTRMPSDGKPCVQISGGKNGLFTGSCTLTYEEKEKETLITKVSLNTAMAGDALTFRGVPVNLEKEWLTVKAGTVTLKEDCFEIVGYILNNRAGKAVAIIRGTGDYSGTKLLSFTIKAQSIPL